MNLPSVKDYTAQLEALLERTDAAAKAIAQMNVMIRAADKAGEREQQLQIIKQRQNAEKQLQQITTALQEHTRREGAEAARTLYFDLAARIDLALEEYVRWRRALAEFEFDVAQARFAEDESQGRTRAQAEARLSQLKEYAEKRVEAAAALVPERPVVLL